MKHIHCETSEQIRLTIDGISPDALYRGQTKEYLNPDGTPSIVTSFSRHGCIPNRMLKWAHYARVLLATFVKDFDPRSDLAIDQAILQHYGWRSFFIDATANPVVAAWFACNSYQSRQHIELCEDCWEDPVHRLRTYARYQPSQDIGCIYAISRKVLRSKNINAVDLVEITTAKGTPRFLAQSAFMIGHLTAPLPPECIIARITAPADALAAYVTESDPGMSMERLFPNTDVDPVLSALLSLPWVKRYISGPGGIDCFTRGLPLPEYYDGFRKIASPSTVFYRRFWIADLAPDEEGVLAPRSYLTSEALYHGIGKDTNHMPLLAKLMGECGQVAIEIDGLVFHPYGDRKAYGKGIFLRREDDGAILISELMVDQYGGRPSGFGIARGLFYTVDSDGTWSRTPHPEECDCGHDAHHAHHLVVAKHFEDALEESRFRPVRQDVYADIDVDPTTDPWILDLVKGAELLAIQPKSEQPPS